MLRRNGRLTTPVPAFALPYFSLIPPFGKAAAVDSIARLHRPTGQAGQQPPWSLPAYAKSFGRQEFLQGEPGLRPLSDNDVIIGHWPYERLLRTPYG